jgi:Fur family transcriptional regulator, zinc uptake regulator
MAEADRASNPAASFPAEGHDHEACIGSALDRAAALCEERGARLTDLRRQVLELVWRGHSAVGAYEILAALQARHPGAAPPTVYRALDFLVEQRLVHRIESLNAYVGCDRPDRPHISQFLICTGCGATAELTDPGIEAAIGRRAEALGFAVEQQTVELRGRCPACRATAPAV